MTSLAPPLPNVVPVPVRFLSYKLAAAFGLAALADWLFYGHPPAYPSSCLQSRW